MLHRPETDSNFMKLRELNILTETVHTIKTTLLESKH